MNKVGTRVYELHARVLEVANELMNPSRQAAKDVRPAYEALLRREASPFELLSHDPASRIFAWELKLPGKPLVIAVYVSAQEWYLDPRIAEPKARKLARFVRSLGHQADVIASVVCRRFTRPCVPVVRRYGVYIATRKGFTRFLEGYFEKRATLLLKRFAGRRIRGELAFLAAFLAAMVRRLLSLTRSEAPWLAIVPSNPLEVELAVLSGWTVPPVAETGPPAEPVR